MEPHVQHVCTAKAQPQGYFSALAQSSQIVSHLNEVVKVCCGCLRCFCHGQVHVPRLVPSLIIHSTASSLLNDDESAGCLVTESCMLRAMTPLCD